MLNDRLNIGWCEVGRRDVCWRVEWPRQAWRWYRVDVVRWSTTDLANTHPHTITRDATIFNLHQHIARLRQIAIQPQDNRCGPRLVFYLNDALNHEGIDVVRRVFGFRSHGACRIAWLQTEIHRKQHDAGCVISAKLDLRGC